MLGKMVPPSAALEPMADDHGAQVEKATKAKDGSGKCICVFLPTDLDGTTVGSWLAMEGKVRWGLYTCRAFSSRRYDYPHRKMSLLSSERQHPFRQPLGSLCLRFSNFRQILHDNRSDSKSQLFKQREHALCASSRITAFPELMSARLKSLRTISKREQAVPGLKKL